MSSYLVVAQGVTEPPPPPPGVPIGAYAHQTPGDPTASATNVDQISYTDGYGEETDLSTIFGEQYKAGLDGRFTAPVEHFSDQVPEQDGARYRGSRVLPNLLTIPITFVADDIATLRAKVREVARALSPKRGIGKLTVFTSDGLGRYVNCVYESGFETDPATEDEIYDARVVLNFRAFDPFWYDIEPVNKRFDNRNNGGTFFPAPPFRIGSSSVFSTFAEDNEGDVRAWPVWDITGPGEKLRLLNETTGEWLAISQAIARGTTIRIDTRPGVKSVRNITGNTNLFPYITGSLWSLAPGLNSLRVEMINAIPDASVNLQYQPGYLGV